MNPGEAGEQIAAASYALGFIAGYEETAKRVRQRAGTLFAQGSDERAKIYRGFAEELEARARLNRQEYETKSRPAYNVAFAFLEGLKEEQ